MAAPQLLDMVLETATNPGTASFILNGAVADRRSFATAAPAGGAVCYYADDGTQAEWGIGVLTIGTPNTLSRQTVFGTTQNTTQALNFTGAVKVYSFLPARLTPVLDAAGNLSVQAGSFTSLSVSGLALVQSVSDWNSYQAVPAASAYNNFVKQGFGFSDFGGNALFFGWREGGGVGVGVDKTDVGTIAFQKWCQDNFPQNTSAISGDGDLRVTEIAWSGTANTGVLYHYNRDGSFGGTYLADRNWASSTFQPVGNYQPAGSYQPAGNYQQAGDYATVGQLPLAVSRRVEAFSASSTDGARVNFPTGFSSADNLVINITCQRSSSRCVIASYENEDAGGFTLGMQREDTNGASQQNSPWTIHVTAIGNR